MKKKIKIVLVQRSGAGSPKENLEEMKVLIKEAAKGCNDLDVVVFPEYCYYAPTSLEESKKVAEEIPGTYTNTIGSLAKKYNINIIPGSFIENARGEKVYNTSLFINREGRVVSRYRKIHLLDALGFKESEYVEPGNEMCVFDTDFGKAGLMVCYDLRFPELARSMVLKGANVIFVPSEFPSGNPLPPRTDHWDILVKSTALYNLTYVVAVNQFGPLNEDHPFGRSSVIDPWGTVIAAASGREEVVYATLDMDYQNHIRKTVATWINRRPDVYEL
jgi:predicted amidohydrolase